MASAPKELCGPKEDNVFNDHEAEHRIFTPHVPGHLFDLPKVLPAQRGMPYHMTAHANSCTAHCFACSAPHTLGQEQETIMLEDLYPSEEVQAISIGMT